MAASLSFAKIIAHHTKTTWSQVYHAGNLFALVSYTTGTEDHDLNALGKDMFNELESNFFSLEKKNLTTITEVIEESLKDLPSSLQVSACIAFSREAILYLFLVGTGTMVMKRGEKIGVLLSRKEADGRIVHTSSGYLNHGDVLLMQTGAFSNLFTFEAITEALDANLPNDITEKLSAQTAELPGDASAVALLYQGATAPDAVTPAQEMRRAMQETSPLEHSGAEEEEAVREVHPALDEAKDDKQAKNEVEAEDDGEAKGEDEERLDDSATEVPAAKESKTEVDEHVDDEEEHPVRPRPRVHEMAPLSLHNDETEIRSPVTVTKTGRSLSLPSRKVLFGIVALILLGILVGSIVFSKQTKQTNASKTVFEQSFAEASKQYEEAEGLKNLNASLAQEDYKKAAASINAALPKVKQGSEEEKKLKELLAKIEPNIQNTEGATATTKAVDLSESPLLSLAAAKATPYVAENEDNVFALTSNAIFEGTKSVIDNDSSWSSPKGLGAYNGNLYVLDTKEGILKFAAGSDGYGKSSYFGSDKPNLASAVSMSIDGSIYVLLSDGKIKKYTKGKEESFVISNLPSPLRSPKQLVTNVNMDNIYILDSGNSRIVQLTKDGAYERAWKAEVIATATVIDVQEKDKKIYLLKGKNLFMLNME